MNSGAAHPSLSTESSPAVSVIIPTYNRKEELQGLLSALDAQTFPASQHEIIIIDDGSSDDTLSYLQGMVKSGKDNVVFFYQKNQGPGTARNRGMALARGTIFAFTDTDCRPFPDWLEELVKPFADKQVGAVGGAEAYIRKDTMLAQAIHFCMTSPLTTGGMRGKTGKKLARYYPRTFNMAISRDVFKATSGFRSLYHGEDIELSFRIKQAGFILHYNELAKVHHRRRVTVRQFFKQLLNMGEARVTLARLHPEMLEPLHLVPAAGLVIFLLAAVLSSFSKISCLLLKLIIIAGLGVTLLVGCAGFRKTKNIKLAFLVPMLFVLQQCAYGMGFFRGLWKWLSPHRIWNSGTHKTL